MKVCIDTSQYAVNVIFQAQKFKRYYLGSKSGYITRRTYNERQGRAKWRKRTTVQILDKDLNTLSPSFLAFP